MAFAREIILMIIKWLSFRIPKTGEKDSYYGEIGGTLIRISNHCTRLRVWDDMLEKNPKWKGKPIISIVFEDNVSTYDTEECLFLKRYRKNPIKVTEYVYNLNGNPKFINSDDIKTIINSVRNIHKGSYTDRTGKCQPPIVRMSQIPNRYSVDTNICGDNGTYQSPNSWGADYVSETIDIYNNIQINYNIIMKQTIRLTESKLRVMIQEAVKEALTENSKQYEQSQGYLDFLEEEGYTEDAIHKVAKDMAENGIESLKDGNREVLCIAFDQNDNLIYSLHQRGWRHVR